MTNFRWMYVAVGILIGLGIANLILAIVGGLTNG